MRFRTCRPRPCSGTGCLPTSGKRRKTSPARSACGFPESSCTSRLITMSGHLIRPPPRSSRYADNSDVAILFSGSRTPCRLRTSASDRIHVCLPRMGGGGRPAVLRAEHHGAVRARRWVRRPDRTWRQARRFAHRATDDVRASGESEDRQGDRHRAADSDPAAGRRGDRMRRRKFILALGGAAAVWPLAARAQQPTIPIVGYLHSDSPQTVAGLLAAFREGLSETGYIEGQNVAIEYRWAENDLSRIPELVADLVRRRVAVIATPGSSATALAAKAATTTIPIVFSIGLDPVQLGLVDSLSRPGGNITGVNSMSNELVAKRLGLLHELLPTATRLGVLVNPQNPTTESLKKDVEAAATAIGPQIEFFTASTGAEIDTAFASLVQKRADALVVHPDNLFINRRVQLITLAARHAVPVIYALRPDAEAGGLMSYGTKLADAHRQAGVYTGRILKGAKPTDLPVVQPTKFEFVINLQTAKTIGLTVPPTLLARADQVIE